MDECRINTQPRRPKDVRERRVAAAVLSAAQFSADSSAGAENLMILLPEQHMAREHIEAALKTLGIQWGTDDVHSEVVALNSEAIRKLGEAGVRNPVLEAVAGVKAGRPRGR